MDTERRLITLPDGRDIDLLLSGRGRILDDLLDLAGPS
jgi:hypothetical protein